jgi:hypothetical protein
MHMRSHTRTALLSTAFLAQVLLATAITIAPSPAVAQVQDVEIEGKFEDIDPANSRVKVMGVWVKLVPGTVITSASGTLKPEDLWNTTPFPGFHAGSRGFVGGTSIVTGTSDSTGLVTADTFFADTAENVLLGTVRKNVNTAKERWFDIEGSKVILLPSSPTGQSYPAYPKRPDGTHPLYDARYKGSPMLNEYGFRIKPTSLLPGTLVAAEGYYGTLDGQNVLFAFLVEASAGEVIEALETTAAVSIQRAQCRQRDANTIDLEVRGGVHNPTGPVAGNVNIFSPAAGGIARQDYGVQGAIADAGTFGIYDFDARITTTQGCPAKVRAQYAGVNSPAAEVEIRID